MTRSYRDLRALPVALVKDAIEAECLVASGLNLAERLGNRVVTWSDETVSYGSASNRTALLIDEAENRGATVALARIARSPASPDRWLLTVEADTPARAARSTATEPGE